MKAIIRCIIVNNTVLKPGYITIVTVNNKPTFCKIIELNNVDNKCILQDIISKELFTVECNFLDNSIKLIAISNKTTFPVIYRDIVPILHILIKSNDSNFINDFINNKVEASLNGFEYNSYVKINPFEAVEITSLYFIDKYKLFNNSDRLFKVNFIIHKDNYKDKHYELESTNGIKFECKRTDFKPIDRLNYKKIFTINAVTK